MLDGIGISKHSTSFNVIESVVICEFFCENRFEVDLHTGFERLLCTSTRTDVILTEKHI